MNGLTPKYFEGPVVALLTPQNSQVFQLHSSSLVSEKNIENFELEIITLNWQWAIIALLFNHPLNLKTVNLVGIATFAVWSIVFLIFNFSFISAHKS